MAKSDLARQMPNLPRSTQREYDAHLAQIQAICNITEQAARAQDDATDRITSQAVKQLEQINANISRSQLPEGQKAQLSGQVEQAFARHEQLLDQAHQAASARIRQAAQEPVRRKESLIDRVASELSKPLDDLSDSLFKW